jgi:uncharacterized pyridoxamine 5'-phosphate oxidase family protein
VILAKAIELLDAVSDFQFKNSEKRPKVSICGTRNDGYSLRMEANLVSEEYRNYLKEVAKSRKLGIRESGGYIEIYGYRL